MYSNLGQACIDEFCPAVTRERIACFVEFLFGNLFKIINIFCDQLMNRFFNL